MSFGLLLIRLAIGLTLAAHGGQKLAGWFGGHGLDATAGAMERMGFRPGRRAAEMAGAGELAGGLAFALGLLTPVAAAALIGVMAVAGVAGHGTKGFFAQKGGWEYPFVLACVAAGVAFTGAGRVSFDAALGLHLGGLLWGFFAVALGLGAAFAQLAARHTEVDLTGAATEPHAAADHDPTRQLPSEADEREEAARRAAAAAEARRLDDQA
ncbi:MAG TPA: DoxX family protein [Acidimicrobiales bacterium]|nr:DoxX family protein [Acidimicrobiales bacterium]